MLGNHFKTARRQIEGKKLYAAINIFGLSIGLCVCIVIYLIVSFEYSFDTFHPDSNRIYRVMSDVMESTGDQTHFARSPFAVPGLVEKELTGVEAIAGVIPYNARITIQEPGKPAKKFSSRRDGTYYPGTVIAQPAWFSIFPQQVLAGEISKDPFTVVLAESKARAYFGQEDLDKMIGRIVVYDDSLFVRVSGVVRDWKGNSDFPYTDFISFATVQSSFLKNAFNGDSWEAGDLSTWTFVKLSPGTTSARLNDQLATLVRNHAGPGVKLRLRLESLSAVHFDEDVVEDPLRTAHKPTLTALSGIAIFILLLAVINFVNLSTAQLMKRSKEVGIRKVLGSSRAGLIIQFLMESFVLTLVAVVLASALVNPVLFLFQSFVPRGVVFKWWSPPTLFFLGLVTLVTSVAAGLYPAKLLSGFQPAVTLRGARARKGGDKWGVRKGLIVFQFTISLIFIIGSIVISNQLAYVRGKDLGFKTDAVVTVPTPWGDSLSKVRVVANEIRRLPGVGEVALEWATPGDAKRMRIKFRRTDEKETGVAQVDGDEHLLPLYQIRLLAGRNLRHSDSVNEFVINAELSREMGYKQPEQAIGKTLYWMDKPYPVVGVVADFHSSSLHDPIVPLCIINRVDRENILAVKLNVKGKQVHEVRTILDQIGRTWKSVYPSAAFDYTFYDESVAAMYEKDRQTEMLMNTAMYITIFISCIGLFGLAIFAAERRTREIGIRKVFGATAMDIMRLLSKDFVALVAIAIVTSSPIAWWFMNQWLDGFAYRVSIGWQVFALAGLSALAIALFTVSYQSIKAALANPVKSLRVD